MGLLMGALAGAAGAVEDTTKYALRSMMDEEKANRIAEYSSRLKSNEDLTTRGRNKADAAEERGRVQTEAQAAADKRGGLLSQSATDAYNALASTDPEGAQAGLDAVNQAKAEGRYKQEPTTKDMLLAQGDIKTIAAMDEKHFASEIRTAIANGRFENALQIAQIKGDFAMTLGELKAASKNGSEKATELMRNITALKGMGKSDKEAIDLLLGGKVGEYTTIHTESIDDKTGAKTTTTRKVKPQPESTAPQRSMMDLFPPKQNQQAPAQAASATASAAPRMTTEDVQPVVVKLEPAGQSMFGRKQFVATYQDGTRKVVSGDDAERQAILMSK